jgi:g-D-glutamyl-meso-diaminopimelate peptidase
MLDMLISSCFQHLPVYLCLSLARKSKDKIKGGAMKKFLFSFTLMFLLFSTKAVMAENIVNPHQAYTYEKMRADIWELKKKYKKEVTVSTIGYSHFGRRILAVKLGRGDKNILFIGAHHGREWLTSTLLMEMLENYATAYHEKDQIGPYSSSIFNDVSIWFVPMLNPDGVTIQQGGWKKFPKYHQKNILAMNDDSYDFKRWKANGLGIDLNRQYPAGWYQVNQDDVASPTYQYYKGKKPITTHETKAIVKFTKKINPLIAVSYHTSGREIYWNYNNGKNKLRDSQIANKVALLTGYDVTKPPKKATGAGYTDWFISTFQKPALTIEISPLVKETSPPLEIFAEEWKRNRFIGMMLAKEAKNINNLK